LEKNIKIMNEEKFELRLDLVSESEEINLYLYELHNYLVNFETSSIKQLLISLDELSVKLTDDINHVTNGELEKLTILSNDAQDKTFDRVMKLVEKIDSFKKVSDMAEALRPDIAKKGETKKSQIKIDPTSNPFEQLQKQRLEGKI
jgi:hypothetical protein